MARSHIAVAVGSAFFVALLLSHLFVTLGFPQADFWHGRLDGKDYSQDSRYFDLKDENGGAATADGSQYLLGVGKADITG